MNSTQLQNAIKLLTGGQAYETPLAADVIERLSLAARDSGFMTQGGFTEAAKLNPISTLLKWVEFSSAPPAPPVTAGDLTWGPAPKDTVLAFTGDNDAFFTALMTMLNGGAYTEFTFNNPVDVTTNVDFNTCAIPTLLDFAALETVGGNFNTIGCPALTTLDVGALTTMGGNFDAHNCLALTTVLCGSWVPTDGTIIRFDGCALTATSVELILRRCVLAGVTTCTIDLSGGTNAGTASLSAQGQADVATLAGQLTINP
jgi:hypothetical protein